MIRVFLLLLFFPLIDLIKLAMPMYFPSSYSVLIYIYQNYAILLFHAKVTLLEMCIGIVLSLVISIPLTWVMLNFKRFADLMRYTLVLIQCIPIFIIAPIMVTLFGFSLFAILIPTVLSLIFPFALTLYKGFQSVPESYIKYFAFYKASKWDVFWKLQVPSAYTHFLSGLRLSCSIAGVGAIAGEWAGAQCGLGVFIQESRRNFNLDGVFSGVFLLVAMSIILYNLIGFLEIRRFTYENRV